MTSSLSKRGNTRRKPLSRRNRRSTPLRRWYSSRPYSRGAARLCFGGTTGMKPRSAASCRVSSSSQARSMTRAGRCDGFSSHFRTDLPDLRCHDKVETVANTGIPGRWCARSAHAFPRIIPGRKVESESRCGSSPLPRRDAHGCRPGPEHGCSLAKFQPYVRYGLRSFFTIALPREYKSPGD